MADISAPRCSTTSTPPTPRVDTIAADECVVNGLHLVEALSARWGWTPQDVGKSVYAILASEA